MVLKLDHITLLVTSFEKSMPYYNILLEHIGFQKLRGHVWSDGNGFFIQFGQANEGTSKYERYGAGMNHIGFAAPNKKFVEQLQAKMINAGFTAPEIQNLGGVQALFMKDSDGIRFEISYYPEGANVVD
ncbi:VOC family protein [Pseudoalteromonas denitrificans]|uniref:Catechol 2,3-dioxygenase n=1 Tax=Pseudoalteromonas denitrificans DSM 6059 TaxID=1123010 RepID=A0A1I1KCW2_9GAMM|nr:VOC family protein [Pseudoalteromonas denitrificans]SFC58315.1 Catechol 2,3-dioxygenase [Pseudoalteromonas denitrificans DSM 6059]